MIRRSALAVLMVVGMTVALIGGFAGAVWLVALGGLMLGVPVVLADNRRETPHPAAPPRPDADVAQYLNDADREWLAGHDWRDPALDRIRITNNGKTIGVGSTPEKAQEAADAASRVVSSVTDESGWRTVEYSDGTREEHAVSFERSQRLEQQVRRNGVAKPRKATAETKARAKQVVDELTSAPAYRITSFQCGSCTGVLAFEIRDDPPQASYVHAGTKLFECAGPFGTDAHTRGLVLRDDVR